MGQAQKFPYKYLVPIINYLELPLNNKGGYNYFNICNPSLPLKYSEEELYYVEKPYMNTPVVGVSWEGAALIALLLQARLPSEQEWEFLATGGEDRIYQWGNDVPSNELANFDENIGHTTEIDKYPPNMFGLHDMAGNVEEWCLDWYYPQLSPFDECSYEDNRKINLEKTVKGGSWSKSANQLKCRSRRGKWYKIGTTNIGFRLIWEVN